MSRLSLGHYLAASMLIICLCPPSSALARAPIDARSEGRIAACIRKSAEGKPWLEKTLWGLRDQEAGWVGAEIVNTNGSHDLGPLQVNSWWVPRIARKLERTEVQVRQWLRDDACFNVDAARWIFLTALTETGDYWRAIGAYHSPTAWRQKRYATKVVLHLRRRFGDGIFSVQRSR